MIYTELSLAVLMLQVLFIFVVLVLAAYYDLKKGIIPIELTIGLIVPGFVFSLFPETIINLFIAGLFLAISIPLYKKNILGGGDIKLITGLILINPFITPEFYMFFGLFTGLAGLGLYLLFMLLKKDILIENATVRFAPAMLIGWVLTMCIVTGII